MGGHAVGDISVAGDVAGGRGTTSVAGLVQWGFTVASCVADFFVRCNESAAMAIVPNPIAASTNAIR